MNLWDLPLDRFCNAVMVWLEERTEAKEWKAWMVRLMTPPPQALANPAVKAMTDAEEGRQFMAFLGAVTGQTEV